MAVKSFCLRLNDQGEWLTGDVTVPIAPFEKALQKLDEKTFALGLPSDICLISDSSHKIGDEYKYVRTVAYKE